MYFENTSTIRIASATAVRAGVGASGDQACAALLRGRIRGLYQRPICQSSTMATKAIDENHAMLGCPNGTMMSAASNGPIAEPKFPPT